MSSSENSYGFVKFEFLSNLSEYIYKTQNLLQNYTDESSTSPSNLASQKYYEAKSMNSGNPQQLLQAFKKVLNVEDGEEGWYGFAALKEIIMIYLKLSEYDDAMDQYKQFLTYIERSVTHNQSMIF